MNIVCSERLHEYFDFPEGTPQIEIQIHNRPSKNRVVLGPWVGLGDVSVDGNFETLPYEADKLLEPLFGEHKTLYAELHYWEP